MKKILLFNTPEIVNKVLSFLNYELINVNKEDYNQQLGYILKLDEYKRNKSLSDVVIKDAMIVFYNLSDSDLNNALSLIKASQIKIDLKAIITEANINWPAVILYNELIKEKEAIKKLS